MGKQIQWADALYQWGSNSFTWNDVAEFVNVAASVGDGMFFAPDVKRQIRKVATPQQIESIVKVVSEINGKISVMKKKKSKLTLKDITVNEIHNTMRILSVKIQVEK